MSQIKEEDILPEEKSVSEDIEERTSNRLRASYIWIKKNMSKKVLNYYYST